jgi:hypothetical protein
MNKDEGCRVKMQFLGPQGNRLLRLEIGTD